MGKEPEWKVDKQPAWLVAAIRRTIADLPHGYEEAAEILDCINLMISPSKRSIA